jgi:hypothetical protein
MRQANGISLKRRNQITDLHCPFQLRQPSGTVTVCSPIELRKTPAGHGKIGA